MQLNFHVNNIERNNFNENNKTFPKHLTLSNFYVSKTISDSKNVII